MTANGNAVLVDANVLVYAYDQSEPAKQRRSLALLDELADGGRMVLTTQVLAEFFVVVSRRIVRPLDMAEAARAVRNYVEMSMVLPVTPDVVLEAIRGTIVHRLAYWDAQVWAAARLADVLLVLSEDLARPTPLETVGFLDPFAAGFVLPW
jgi:predicted nucleic acid-binding protein